MSSDTFFFEFFYFSIPLPGAYDHIGVISKILCRENRTECYINILCNMGHDDGR